MARMQPDAGLKPSILDRLIDPDSSGTARRPGYSLQQINEVIRRDVEDLLNTRRTVDGSPGLQNSVLTFGLPEITEEVITPDQKRELGQILARTIGSFEPRLRDIQVRVKDSEDKDARAISFRIEARLALEPFDDVAFQTVLDLASGAYSVEQTQ